MTECGELARWLPRAGHVFFGRFGRLRKVQRAAIPVILSRRDALLVAATAAGKTEAFAAPIAEQLLERSVGRPGVRALIVTPTRALANDLQRRLRGRLDALGITLGRRTGEHKERPGGHPPAVTIATPESLDALLARAPRALASLETVVLDEIHVLDGTARGDQLRILLHRTASAGRGDPQRIASSATVDDPPGVASRYLRDAAVITATGERHLRIRFLSDRSPAALAAHVRELARAGFRKILVFCNRRAEVEDVARRLGGARPFAGRAFAHHGSLARATRLRAERRFLDATAAVLCATSTLELGVDIGDVDFVLLAGPPPGVASALQRVGRGCRRTGAARAAVAVADLGEEHIARCLLRAGARGQLLARRAAFRAGVLVQQALVLAGSSGWVDAARLAGAVPRELWREVAPATSQDILQSMVGDDLLARAGAGRFVLSDELERRYARGLLHSNIQDECGDEVVDRLSGDLLGRVAPRRLSEIRIGGSDRRIVTRRRGRIFTDASRACGRAQFPSRGAPTASLAQGRAVVCALGVARDAVELRRGAGAFVLLHGLGRIGGMLLFDLLKAADPNSPPTGYTSYTVRLHRPLARLPAVHAPEVSAFVRARERDLARRLATGPWHRSLPAALRRQVVVRAGELEEIARFLRSARLVRGSDDATCADPRIASL